MHVSGFNRGFTLIEVLVSLAILVFGLLGIAGLTAKGQRAAFEAYQRQQALSLAQDMAERIIANPSAASDYVTAVDGSGPGYDGNLAAGTDCRGSACNATQLADFDLSEWDRLLFGSSETLGGNRVGGILNARGCVEEVAGNRFMVSVAWQGDTASGDPSVVGCQGAPVSECGKDLYGAEGGANSQTRRRLVSLCLTTRQTAPGGGS